MYYIPALRCRIHENGNPLEGELIPTRVPRRRRRRRRQADPKQHIITGVPNVCTAVTIGTRGPGKGLLGTGTLYQLSACVCLPGFNP